MILLEDGRMVTGFVTREAADTVTLRLADATEVTLRKAAIEERNDLDGVSVMPAGLVAELSPEDFASLVTFVQSPAPSPAP